MTRNRIPWQERLWPNIDKRGPDECWPWTAHAGPNGYGQVRVGASSSTAHRLVYALVHGDIPPGMVIRHKCDNPPCCNPAHLEIGTAKQNYQDMIDRRRTDWQRGLKRQFGARVRKLTDPEVRGIRYMKEQGLSASRIAEHYDVSEPHVFAILNGGRKAHVKQDSGMVSLRARHDRQTAAEVIRLLPLASVVSKKNL